MFKIIPVDQFVNEFMDYPSYDNIRKIASVVDGLKNSSRKVVYYCLKNNIPKPVKTSQIKAQIEHQTQYLHGDISGVVETLAKKYIGTNNINLLEPHGNFGTEMVKESSASRYTYTKPSPELYNIFDKTDLEILDRQYFEGDEIEPVYLMPILPMLLINGSEGISSGFAQKVLSRDPKGIQKAIKRKLVGNYIYDEAPWFRGFTGIVDAGENPNQWHIKGIVEQINTSSVHIKSVPFIYDLAGYLKVLDTLEDNGIIRGYEDNSETEFDFVVKFTRDSLASYKTNDDLLRALKLIRTVTENYTVQDEHNRVIIFDNTNDMMDHFMAVRERFLFKKIEHKKTTIQSHLDVLQWRVNFIDAIIYKKLVINNRKKTEVVQDLDNTDNIGKVDNSYDYLLNMNLLSLTTERIDKLNKEIKEHKSLYDYFDTTTPNDFYLDELKTSKI